MSVAMEKYIKKRPGRATELKNKKTPISSKAPTAIQTIFKITIKMTPFYWLKFETTTTRRSNETLKITTRTIFTKQDCQSAAKLCLAPPTRSGSSSSCRKWDSHCSCKAPPRAETLGNAGTGSRVLRTSPPGRRTARCASGRWRLRGSCSDRRRRQCPSTRGPTASKWGRVIRLATNNLIEDLIITGGHGILVDDLGDQYESNQRYYGTNVKIEDKYLFVAENCPLFTKIEDNSIFTYYHFVLQNDGDNDKRYGVWANGILTETPSLNQFMVYALNPQF